MEIIKINDRDFIANIKWSASVDKKELNKKFTSLAKEATDAKFGLICNYKNQYVVGMLEGDGKKPKNPSAAIYLANANAKEYSEVINVGEEGNGHNLAWICVEEIENDKFWVGAAFNGLPIEDKIVSSNVDSIRQEIDELLSMIEIFSGDKQVATTIFVSDENLNILLNRDTNQKTGVLVSKKEFSEIILDVKYKATIRKTSNLGSVVAVSLLAVLLGVGGYFAYTLYEEYQEEQYQIEQQKEAEMSEEALKKAQQKYEEDKKVAIQKAKEQAIETMNKKVSNPKVEEVLSNWYDLLKVENNSYQGWSRTKIVCELENKEKPTCTYEFIRNSNNDVGTVKGVMDQFGHRNVVVDFDGNKALITRNIDEVLSKVNYDYKELEDYKLLQFQLNALSKIQILELAEVRRKFEKPILVETEIDLPEPPKGIKQQRDNLKKINLGIEEGNFTLSGKDLFKLKAMSDDLSKINKPFAIDSVIISTSDGVNMDWNVSGRYYIQSDKFKNNLDTIENEIPKSEIIKNSK